MVLLKSWRSNRGNDLMDDYRKTHYANNPLIPPAPPDDADVLSGPGDTDDLDYKTPFPPPRRRKGMRVICRKSWTNSIWF